MAEGKFVAYYRVSTGKQGRSGLGLEAQRSAVQTYLNGGDWTLVREFTEVESGKNSDRPVLAEALRFAELSGAILVVAKLDRLSRNAAFLNTLFDSGRAVIFCDMPHADRMMIGVMAQIAQWEADQISKRTKEALQAAKERGVKLGGDRGNLSDQSASGRAQSALVRKVNADSRAAKVMHYVEEAKAQGHQTFRAIAAYLNNTGIQTPRGKMWHAASVQKMMLRKEAIA